MSGNCRGPLVIAFRVDASIQIGNGHVIRCLTLADELNRKGHTCFFICREHRGHLGNLIAGKGYDITLLPQPPHTAASHAEGGTACDSSLWLGVPWEVDAAQTLDLVAPLGVDWLVVDHYSLDIAWERVLADTVDNVMVIDDLANRSHQCKLLLDQNLGRVAVDYDGLLPDSCHRLIGPRYALLRPEFSSFRERSLQRRQNPTLKRILISLGGVDRTNITCRVLEVLEQSALPSDTELDIIIGATAPYLDRIRQLAAQSRFKVAVNVDVEDVAERMCLADLSIGAAGGTSWERCCMGLPAVLVILAENQISGAKALEASNAAITIGNPAQLGVNLPSLLVDLTDKNRLYRMSEAAAFITDGKGGMIVAQGMVSACERYNDITSIPSNDRRSS